MAVIESLDVLLTAKTEKFDRGFNHADRVAKNFGRSLTGAANKVSGFEPQLPMVGRLSGLLSGLGPAGLAAGAAIGGVTLAVGALSAAVAYLAANVSARLPEIDKLGKAADVIGITTDRLAGLRLAAGEVSGASAEMVDKSLMGMARRISEAAAGAGEAKAVLEEMGVDVAALSKLRPDEQFSRLSDLISDAATKSDQLRIASKLFGEEGARLVSTLRGGPAALEETYNWAVKFGLALSDAQVNGVETFNDKFARLNTLAEGFWNSLTAEIAPALIVIADDLIGMVESGNAFSDVVGGVGLKAAQLYGIIADIALILKGISAFSIDPFQAIQDIDAGLQFRNGANAAMDYIRRLQAAQAAQAELGTGAPVEAPGQSTADSLLTKFADPSDKLAATIAELQQLNADGLIGDRTELQAAREAMAAFEAGLQNLDPTGDLSDKLRLGVTEIREAFQAGLLDESAVGQLTANLEAAFSEAATNGIASADLRTEIAEAFADGSINQGTVDKLSAEADKLERIEMFGKDDVAEAERLAKEFQPVGDRVADEVARIEGMLANGLIDPQVAAAATKAAQDQLGEKDTQREAPSFGALQAGSVAAYRAAVGNEKNDQLAEAKQQTKALATIKGVLDKALAALQNLQPTEAV